MDEIVSGTTREVLAALLADPSPAVVVSVPTADVLRAVTDVLCEDRPTVGETEPVRVLVTADATIPLTGRHRDLGLTARLAELDAADRIDVRETDPSVPTTRVVTPDRVGVVDVQDGHAYGVCGAVPEGDRIHERAITAADAASPAEIGAPPLSTVRTELRDRFGPAVATAFDETFSTVRSRSDAGPDAAKLLLWLGGRFGLRYSEVRAFAAETGFSSRTTLSRRLSAMIEDGVLEAVPERDGEGHPTKRLRLAVDVSGDGRSDHVIHYLS
ncbi:MAG: DUF5821 family protein [Halobaculum sp.]